jgi:[lysine-biosynthesis-protein LysW]--L-2-aminoadipate ligase
MNIGVVYSRLRLEEKWLFAALEQRGISHDRVLDRDATLQLTRGAGEWSRYDVVLLRSMSTSRGLYIARVLNSLGVLTVNSYTVSDLCSDKVATTTALTTAGLPQPESQIAFTSEAALVAGEKLGYPYVLKPVIGSWGRLVSRINDRNAAEAVFEHREVLGHFQHNIYYMQELIDKPGRDIRAFVIGDQIPVAIYRNSEHWLTNTARGATASECPVYPELHDLCQRAAEAVGGGVLAIDLLEDPQRGLLINEINHTMEFRSTVPVTGVDLPGMIIEHVLKVGI